MKTTKSDFSVFKKEVVRLLGVYGLTDWEFTVIHKYIDNSTVSQTAAHFESRMVIFTLNTVIDFNSDITFIKNSAHHEVLELLLWRLESWTCASRKTMAREEVHAIIQAIINAKGR